MKLTDIRREYDLDKLTRESLNVDPMEQFNLWLRQAIEFGLSDPTAMTVATVDENGRPYQRIVLLKDSNKDGLVFYTNLSSRKAQQLENNPNISLHFPWHSMERQVHFTGKVEKLTTAENMAYFLSRPKESQLAALASRQSERISTRGLLESKFLELKKKFAEGDITAPKFWGGYRVKIESVEFWQGGEHRLHDRFIYTQASDSVESSWDIGRLAP